jgi:hypothetical protein
MMVPIYLSVMQPSTVDHSLPPARHATFWILCDQGLKTATVDTREFDQPGHPLFALFAKTQDLITEIRMVDQRQRSQ